MLRTLTTGASRGSAIMGLGRAMPTPANFSASADKACAADHWSDRMLANVELYHEPIESLRLDPPRGPILLLRPARRRWGSSLPSSTFTHNELSAMHMHIPDAAGAVKMAFIRDVYAKAGALPFDKFLSLLPSGGVAITAPITRSERKHVVDVYVLDNAGRWRVEERGKELCGYLHAQGLPLTMVPDAAALPGAENFAREGATEGVKQSSNEVLMVAPTAFESNAQTAEDNFFMAGAGGGRVGDGGKIRRAACEEHAGLQHVLDAAGVKIHLFEHSEEHGTPDAVFPNNWFSTHQAGEGGGAGGGEATLVRYPLKCPNRRRERRADIVSYLRGLGRHPREVDLSGAEARGHFFEGTGVLVLDRPRGIAYVALSERAHEEAAREWAAASGYREVVTFSATDSEGRPIYHTNVMMAVGTSVAVVCAESVEDPGERARLLASLSRHHEVVEITREQMGRFCGNVLEVRDGRGLPCLAMSSQAYGAFTAGQRAALRRHVSELLHAPIDTIERVGGGGVRCALAEVF